MCLQYVYYSFQNTVGKVTSNFSFSHSVFYPFCQTFCPFSLHLNSCLQTFLVWKGLKFVAWERFNAISNIISVILQYPEQVSMLSWLYFYIFFFPSHRMLSCCFVKTMVIDERGTKPFAMTHQSMPRNWPSRMNRPTSVLKSNSHICPQSFHPFQNKPLILRVRSTSLFENTGKRRNCSQCFLPLWKTLCNFLQI